LYDLAFIAADKPQKKAEIADSTKNRTALAHSVWVKEATEEERLADEASSQGRYIKDLPELAKKKKSGKTSEDNKRDIEKLPENWTSVHFYLNHLENQGYALIYNGCDRSWKEEKFDFAELFQSFLTWQTNYSRYGMKAAPYLVDLCISIGKSMPFLFNIPESHSVVFIPHDFLRRLPLHGAIRTVDGKKEVFLEKHASCYLPAWNLPQITDEGNSTENYLLKNFNEYRYEALKNKITNGNIFDSISRAGIEKLDKHPNYLFLLCHGKADSANPFNSKLRLKDEPLAYRDIQGLKMNLNGSKIFLGACESDLLPPQSDTVDEHLSLSSAFINKGASIVVGAMWEIYFTVLEKVFIKLFDNNATALFLQQWQKEGIVKWRDNNNPEAFSNYIALRLIINSFKCTV